MSWYALEKIDEALDDTKGLLLPFDLGTWARLALIVALTGGGGFGGLTNLPSTSSPGTGDFSSTGTSGTAYAPQTSLGTSVQAPDIGSVSPSTGLATAAPSNSVLLFLGIFLAGLIIALLYLASVFEFIFYQSLLDENVQIRENFRNHAGNGLRYFGFQLLYILVVILIVAGVVGAFMADTGIGALSLLVAIPAIIAWSIFGGLVHDFVLLNMIENRSALFESWKNVWPDIREEPKQLGMYLLIRFFINLTIGITTFIIALIVTVMLAIPFIALGFLFAMVSPLLAIIPAVIGIALWAVLMLFITVPFRTFFYYWLILIYHEFTS